MSQPLPRHHFLYLLQPALQKNHESPVFRGPNLGSTSELRCITFGEFDRHLAAARSHWGRTLTDSGLKSRDVVGVWLTGRKYEDIVNILSLSAAGYVPQLFGTLFSNPAVIWDLLVGSHAKCLIFDATFSASTASAPVPTFPSLTFSDLQLITNSNNTLDLVSIPAVSQGDTAFFVHSSGTTSGMPKIIPTRHIWVTTFIEDKYAACVEQRSCQGQNVINVVGSLAHVGALCGFIGAVYCGSCIAQPLSMGFSTEDVLSMIRSSGLTNLLVYATFLSTHIHNARKDPNVLTALQGLRQIIHTGVALDHEDADWAYKHSLPITATYATSETSPLLTSVLGNNPSDRLLRLVPGTTAKLIPSVSTDSTEVQDEYRPVLFEMVVPQGAPDSPHPSFVSEDGLYHTGDLFEEVEKGLYEFRGRTGDWIKTALGGFVDTKSTEDQVRKVCSDLVHDVVVCGALRPLPCLFIENVTPGLDDAARHQVAQEIVARMASFNERLFPYERVDDPKRVFVLEQGALPRTKEKMNIRRNATEQLFKKDLDALYA